MFFWRFFKPASFQFILFNVIRFLGILAILLVISSQFVDTVNNIKTFHRHNDSASTNISSPNSTVAPIASTATAFPASTALPNSTKNTKNATKTSKRDSMRFERVTLPFKRQSVIQPAQLAAVNQDATDDSCGYVLSTNVPDQAGGILFSTLYAFFNIVLLVFILTSEIPLPRISAFLDRWFAPLGPSHGVGWLGAIMLWIAAGVLSHHVNTFSLVSAWLLFVLGVFNLCFGLVFGSTIRQIRAIMSGGNSSPLDKIPTKISSPMNKIPTKMGKSQSSYQESSISFSHPTLEPQAPLYQPPSQTGRSGVERW